MIDSDYTFLSDFYIKNILKQEPFEGSCFFLLFYMYVYDVLVEFVAFFSYEVFQPGQMFLCVYSGAVNVAAYYGIHDRLMLSGLILES